MVIVGGTNAMMGEAPWQVLIENMNNAEICGGAIVNELFVLTAAHCTELFRQNGAGKFKYPDNILSNLPMDDFGSSGRAQHDDLEVQSSILSGFKYLYVSAYSRE